VIVEAVRSGFEIVPRDGSASAALLLDQKSWDVKARLLSQPRAAPFVIPI
jgi:hypothetical protein